MPHITHVRQKNKFQYVNRDAPTTPTDIATKTTHVGKIRVANRTAGDLTFTLKDKSATPIEKYEAVNMPANSVTLEVMGDFPEEFTNGITIDTSGSGLSVTIEGFQEP